MQSLHCTTLLAMIGRVSQNCFLSCIMFAEFATAAGGQGRAPAISHRPSCAVSRLAAGGRGVTQRTFATFSHRF